MIKISTKPNTNGNTTQIQIDNNNKVIYYGSYLFISGDITATKKQLVDIINAFKTDGYKIINK